MTRIVYLNDQSENEIKRRKQKDRGIKINGNSNGNIGRKSDLIERFQSKTY